MWLECPKPSMLVSLLKAPLEFDVFDDLKNNLDVTALEYTDILQLFSLYDSEQKAINNVIDNIINEFRMLDIEKLHSIMSKEKLTDSDFEVFGDSVYIKTPRGQVQYATNICYQIDRIVTHFKINEIASEIDITEGCSRLIKFYRFNELIYIVFSGIAVVKKINGEFHLTPKNSDVTKIVKRKLFSNHWERLSSVSIYGLLDSIRDNIDNKQLIKEIESRAKNLRDRMFYVPFLLDTYDCDDLPDLTWMNKICLVSVLAVYYNKINKKWISEKTLRKFKVLSLDINIIQKANNELDFCSKYLEIKKGRVRLVKPDIDVRSLFESVNSSFGEDFIKKFSTKLSGFFEKGYLRQYFKKNINEYSNFYEIYDFGISKHDLDDDFLAANPKFKFDIDLIIKDKIRSKYLFVQSKYISKSARHFHQGDMEILRGNLAGGVRQINGAVEAFKRGAIDKFLEKNGISIQRQDDAVFCLIHNLSDFDFQILKSGAISYDWNTFRNLLKDTMHYGGNSKSVPQAIPMNRSLPLEDPDFAREWLFNHSPIFTNENANPFVNSKEIYSVIDHEISMKFGGNSINSRGFGV
jgi:hypothetical protein